jgi:hypothetical protein
MAHRQTAQAATDNSATFAEATVGTTLTGSMLVALVGNFATGANFSSISDDGSHTWSEVGTFLATGVNQNLRVFYTLNITGRAAHKVRATMTGAGGFPAIIVSEHDGVLTSGAFDVTATGGPTASTTPATAATATRAQATELLIGAMVSDQAGNTAFTAGTNVAWTIPTNGSITDGSQFVPCALEYFYASAVGTERAEFTQNGADSWVCRIATFKLDTGSETISVDKWNPMARHLSRPKPMALPSGMTPPNRVS